MLKSTTRISTGEEYIQKSPAIVPPSPRPQFEDFANEILVQIFRFATFEPETPGIAQLSQGSGRTRLASVCRRWREVLESAVCIFWPHQMRVEIRDSSPEYVGPIASIPWVSDTPTRAAIRRIGLEAKFSGPLHVLVVWLYTRNTLDLSDLARALAEPHRATLCLTLCAAMTVKPIRQLMAKNKCFHRVASISINIHGQAADDMESLNSLAIPEFPMLRIISLSNPGLEDVRGVENTQKITGEEWSWLFSPAVMGQLRSFRATFIRLEDILWLLAHAPDLRELCLCHIDLPPHEQNNQYSGNRSLSHPKVERLAFEFGPYFSLHFPSLRTFVVTSLDWLSRTIPRLDLSAQTTQGLTSVSIPFAKDNSTASTLRALPYLNHLLLNPIGERGLTALANLLEDPSVLPLLQTLLIQFNSDSSRNNQILGDTDAITQAFKRLTMPRGHGTAGIKVLNFGLSNVEPFSEKYKSKRAAIWEMLRVLNGAEGQHQSLETSFDTELNAIWECIERAGQV